MILTLVTRFYLFCISMITRVSTPRQIKKTAELAHNIWNAHYTPIIGQAQVDYMLKNIQSEKAIQEQIASGYEYFLLSESEASVGYLGLRPDYPKGKLMISKIYVDPTYQGKGYGKKLLEHTKQFSLAGEMNYIWLTVNRHNSNSISWYEKKGFVKIKEAQFDIGNGYIMDDFVLEVATQKLLL